MGIAKTIVIEVKKLHKTFNLGKQTIEILKGIDLQIRSGEYIILFGPSGCGKSTLLNSLSGLEPPSEGEVLIRGESLYGKKESELTEYRRSKIGIVFQQFNLLKSLTNQENVALPLAAGGEKYKRRMERAAHLLEMVGLAKFLNHKPMELSGGQQQRVSIARALAVNPWILICDEPTGNLDSESAEEVMEILYHLNAKSKRTIILVTHNPEYLHYPHRVIFIKDGLIAKEQVNREIISSETTHEQPIEELDMKDMIKKEDNPEASKEDDEGEKKKTTNDKDSHGY